MVTKVYHCTGEFVIFLTLWPNFLFTICFSMTTYLTLYFLSCSRIVEAQSPMAIVIPLRGSSFSMKLRDGDISWHDFLGRVEDLRYALHIDI